MLIRRAEIRPGTLRDLRLRGEAIAAVAPRLEPHPGEAVLDAEGGALLPGLHDHHLHLLALARARESVACGPPRVRNRAELGSVLEAARPDTRGWIRGIGYHESVAGELDRHALDALRDDLPVRIQHASGALWILNSRAVEAVGLDRGTPPPGAERDARGRATGRLFRLDGWLRARLPPPPPLGLGAVGRDLARLGITGVTDATAGNGPQELRILEAALDAGDLPQRLFVLGHESLPEPGQSRAARGPLKIVLAEGALPTPRALTGRIAESHARGRPVAIHCTTRVELVVAAVALREAGHLDGDRIEHASVAPPEVLPLLSQLGVRIVTQPHFVWERGDRYLEEVDPADRPWLYRARGFLEAGLSLAAGSDAPLADPDPWAAMRAAMTRRTRGGAVLAPGESLSFDEALRLFLSDPADPGGAPRRVEAGASADLCLLRVPWTEAARAPAAALVRETWCAGRPISEPSAAEGRRLRRDAPPGPGRPPGDRSVRPG